MDKFKSKFISLIVGGVAFLFGNNPTTLKVVYSLMIFIAFDVITGLFKISYQKEKFDYRFFGNGIMNKICILMCVSFGYWIDYFNIFHTDVNFEIAFASAFLIQEVTSIFSNFTQMGIEIPLLNKYVKL